MPEFSVLHAGIGSRPAPSRVADEPRTVSRGQLASRIVFGGGYLLAAVFCALFLPKGHGFSVVAPAVILLCIVGERVRLWQSETWITGVQAAFVFLSFTIPLNLVPFALLLVQACGLPRAGRRPLMQVAVAACNSWFGFGVPVLLAWLAPGPASWNHWPAYVATLAGQATVEQVVMGARCRLSGMRLLWSERLAGLRVEACLTPVGLAAATELHSSPGGALALMVGFTGVLVLVGHEHHQRWIQAARALRDPLTGLANRAQFDETATEFEARCRRKNEHAGLLLIDLDDFKPINDSLGHKAGDEVLCAFADRLRAHVRAVDVPVRLGGDEFAVLLAEPMDADGVREVADKLRTRLADSVELTTGQQASIRFSVGSALFGLDASIQEAAVEADGALYANKRARKQSEPTPDP